MVEIISLDPPKKQRASLFQEMQFWHTGFIIKVLEDFFEK